MSQTCQRKQAKKKKRWLAVYKADRICVEQAFPVKNIEVCMSVHCM